MALERDRLNNAYTSRLDSYIIYKLLLSDIMRKTFFDFEKNVSMIDNWKKKIHTNHIDTNLFFLTLVTDPLCLLY